MKKKIFSLLLVVSLMFVFTISAYAAGASTDFSLMPDKNAFVTINSRNMDKDDTDLRISVVTRSNADYRIYVRDVNSSRIIIDKEYKGSKSMNFLNVINPNHNYRIVIENKDSSNIKGNLTALVYH